MNQKDNSGSDEEEIAEKEDEEKIDLEKLKNKKKKNKLMIHEEKDLYAVLGFNSPHETNTDDIRNSYKKLALQYHPDK